MWCWKRRPARVELRMENTLPATSQWREKNSVEKLPPSSPTIQLGQGLFLTILYSFFKRKKHIMCIVALHFPWQKYGYVRYVRKWSTPNDSFPCQKCQKCIFGMVAGTPFLDNTQRSLLKDSGSLCQACALRLRCFEQLQQWEDEAKLKPWVTDCSWDQVGNLSGRGTTRFIQTDDLRVVIPAASNKVYLHE